MAGTLLVIGASGDVGQGVTRAALAEGWSVAAAGRGRAKLEHLFAAETGMGANICEGDVATADGARALWSAAVAAVGPVDAVVVSVNAPNRTAPLSQWTDDDLAVLLRANLLTHFNVAKVMLPLLPAHGMLIGIGGGTADFIIPGMVPLSIAQAGQRMLYRGLARERTDGAQIRELMIVSMVNGGRKREQAHPDWVTDDDIGHHVCAVLSRPESFPGPILQLRSRDQVGRPDADPQ